MLHLVLELPKGCENNVYSFGVTLWELVTGEKPWSEFEKNDDVYLNVSEGEMLQVPANCNLELGKIMKDCGSFS